MKKRNKRNKRNKSFQKSPTSGKPDLHVTNRGYLGLCSDVCGGEDSVWSSMGGLTFNATAFSRSRSDRGPMLLEMGPSLAPETSSKRPSNIVMGMFDNVMCQMHLPSLVQQ